MKNDLDPRKILGIVDKITQLGQKQALGFHYKGIDLNTDLEGYSIELCDSCCHLYFYFHHKYHLDYDTQQALDNFMAKLALIEKSEKE